MPVDISNIRDYYDDMKNIDGKIKYRRTKYKDEEIQKLEDLGLPIRKIAGALGYDYQCLWAYWNRKKKKEARNG
jgi:hypothetical protein